LAKTCLASSAQNLKPKKMSKRERQFLTNMTADLLKLHAAGEITELTLKVARNSVSYTYINGLRMDPQTGLPAASV
jgi:hypothetical protein